MDISAWITEALASGRTSEELASTFVKTLNEIEKDRVQKKAKEEYDIYIDDLILNQLGKDIKEQHMTNETTAVVAVLALLAQDPSITKQEAEVYRKMIAEAIGTAGNLFIELRNKGGKLPETLKCAFKFTDKHHPEQVTTYSSLDFDPQPKIAEFLREVGLL